MSIPETKIQPTIVDKTNTHEIWRQKVNETIDRLNSLYQSDDELYVDGNIHNVGYHSLKDSGEVERIKFDANGVSFFNSGDVGIWNESPAYALDVTGDINFTGNLRDSGNIVQFSQWITSGNDIYYDSGNVGIGTDSPGGDLGIKSSSTGSYLLNLDYANNTDMGGFYESATLGGSLFLKDTSNNSVVQITTEGNTFFKGGNVGIGTSSPAQALHVAVASNDIARFESTTTNGSATIELKPQSTAGVARIDVVDIASDFRISTVNTADAFCIEDGGNVGIGTSSPSSKLQLYDATNQQDISLEMTGGWDGNFHGSSRITVGRTGQSAYAGKLRIQNKYWDGNAYDWWDSITSDIDGGTTISGLATGNDSFEKNRLAIRAEEDPVGETGLAISTKTTLDDGNKEWRMYLNQTSGDLHFNYDVRTAAVVGGGSYMSIDTNGNLGVGRNADDGILTRLHVEQSTNPIVTIESNVSQFAGDFGTVRFVNATSANSNYYAEISGYNPSDTYGDQRQLHFKTGLASNDQKMVLDQYGRLHVKSEDVNAYIYVNSAGVNPAGDVGITFQHTDALDVTSNFWTLQNDHSDGNKFVIFNNTQSETALSIDNTTSDVAIQNGDLLVKKELHLDATVGLIRNINNSAIIKAQSGELMIGPGGAGIVTFHNTGTMTGGDEFARMASDGNWGFGTKTTTEAHYTFQKNTATDPIVMIKSQGSDPGLCFYDVANAQQFILGIDASNDSDALTLSKGTGLGSSDIMSISDKGIMNLHRYSSDLTSGDAHGITFSQRNDTVKPSGDSRAGIFYHYNGNLFLSTSTTDLTSDPISKSRLFIKSNGNVGINTIAPGAKLDVTNGNIRISDTRTNVEPLDSVGALEFYNEDATYGAGVHAEIKSVAQDYGASYRLEFNTGTVNAKNGIMALKSNSFVGIGTNTPEQQLHIINDDGASYIVADSYREDSYFAGGLNLRRARGTLSSPTLVNINDILGIVSFDGYDGNGFHPSVQIRGLVDNTPGNDDMGGRLEFLTSPNDSISPTIRMVVKSDGLVGIGTSSPGSKLTVADSAFTLDGKSQGIFLRGSAQPNSGDYSPALLFGWGAGRSGITGTHESADPDNMGLAFFTHPSSTGSDPSIERMRISSNGSVGIGTSSPDRTLQVNNENGEAFVRILGKNTDKSGIEFSDTSDSVVSSIYHDHTTDDLHFNGYNNATRMIIDANGRLGIGTTGPSFGRLQIENDEGIDNFLALRSNAGNNRLLSTWINDTDGTIDFSSRTGSGSSIYDFRFRSGSANGQVNLRLGDTDPNGLNAGYSTLSISDTTNGAQLQLRGLSPKLFFDNSSGGEGEIYIDSKPLKIYGATPANPGTNIITFQNDGRLQVGAGSGATPSLSFNADADTGIYRSATNKIGFSTNGAGRVWISNDGLGVGTSSPGSALDVVGTIKGDTFTNLASPESVSHIDASGLHETSEFTIPVGGTDLMLGGVYDSSGNKLGGGVLTLLGGSDNSISQQIWFAKEDDINYSSIWHANSTGTIHINSGGKHINLYHTDGGSYKGTVSMGTAITDATTLPDEINDVVIGDFHAATPSAGRGMTILSKSDQVGKIAFGDSVGTQNGWVRYDHSTDNLYMGAGGSDIMTVISDGISIGADTNANTNLNMLSDITGRCTIKFGDDDNDDVGMIDYNHNLNVMTFTTASNKEWKITSTGQLLGTGYIMQCGSIISEGTIISAGKISSLSGSDIESDGDLIASGNITTVSGNIASTNGNIETTGTGHIQTTGSGDIKSAGDLTVDGDATVSGTLTAKGLFIPVSANSNGRIIDVNGLSAYNSNTKGWKHIDYSTYNIPDNSILMCMLYVADTAPNVNSNADSKVYVQSVGNETQDATINDIIHYSNQRNEHDITTLVDYSAGMVFLIPNDNTTSGGILIGTGTTVVNIFTLRIVGYITT